MPRKQTSPDVPQTVTVFKNGAPAIEIKVGDAGSASAVAATYRNRGLVVEVAETEPAS